MAGRRERCDGCGVYLPVPPEARVIRCSRCNSDTRVRPFDGWAQVHDSLVPVYPENGFPQVHAPQQRPVSLSPHPARQRRKALLIGLNYRNQSCSLKGSINDVKSMRALLVRRLGFQSDSILMLTEEEMNPLLIPTKENIRKVMRWLVGGCQPGDSLVFHYSGHGSRKKDSNGDEIDGFDEAICPLDHEKKGLILDDEINSTMVRPLPQGVTLHAVIDSCYSGTVFDLPYHCRMNSFNSDAEKDITCGNLNIRRLPMPIIREQAGDLLSVSVLVVIRKEVETQLLSQGQKLGLEP